MGLLLLPMNCRLEKTAAYSYDFVLAERELEFISFGMSRKYLCTLTGSGC